MRSLALPGMAWGCLILVACSREPSSATTNGDGGAGTGGGPGGTGNSGGATITGAAGSGPDGFDLARDGNTYTATSRSNPQVKVEVDCDDQADDGHYFSITPTINGRRMDGPLWGTNIGLILHDDDASYGLTDANRCVSVQVAGARLSTRFLSGTYKNLAATGSDDPVPMDADFYVDSTKHLVAELSGLYYILPSVQNTTVVITANGTVQQRAFTPSTPDTLEYFDNVTRVDVDDPVFGHFTVETNIPLLQLQREVAYSRFELDYDHSFTDRGQKSVSSTVTFY